MTPDILPKAADPKHLTDAFCRSGALADARICDVGVLSSRATVLSPIVRLQSTYDGDPESGLRVLFLKTALPDGTEKGWNAGRKEVAFYTDVAAAMPTHLGPLALKLSGMKPATICTSCSRISRRRMLSPRAGQCRRARRSARALSKRGLASCGLLGRSASGISVGSCSTEADTDSDRSKPV